MDIVDNILYFVDRANNEVRNCDLKESPASCVYSIGGQNRSQIESRIKKPYSIAVSNRSVYIAHDASISVLDLDTDEWRSLRNNTMQVMAMQVYDKDGRSLGST